jgi:hypothetical protein
VASRFCFDGAKCDRCHANPYLTSRMLITTVVYQCLFFIASMIIILL